MYKIWLHGFIKNKKKDSQDCIERFFSQIKTIKYQMKTPSRQEIEHQSKMTQHKICYMTAQGVINSPLDRN